MSRKIPVTLKNLAGVCFLIPISFLIFKTLIFKSTTDGTDFDLLLFRLFPLLALVVFFFLSIYVARIDAHLSPRPSKTKTEKIIESAIIIALIFIIAAGLFLVV